MNREESCHVHTLPHLGWEEPGLLSRCNGYAAQRTHSPLLPGCDEALLGARERRKELREVVDHRVVAEHLRGVRFDGGAEHLAVPKTLS